MFPISRLASIISQNGGAAAVPTIATLSGPFSISINNAITYTVTLDTTADQSYSVTWITDGVPSSTSTTILTGATSTSITITWSAATTGNVDFSISPTLTRAGRPLSVTVTGAITIYTEAVNRAGLVWPDAFMWEPSYSRSTSTIFWNPGQAVNLMYKRGRMDPPPPGEPDGMDDRTYTLFIDGVAYDTQHVAQGTHWWYFNFTAPTTPGWKTLTVTGMQNGETAFTYFALVNGTTSALIPVVQSTLELDHMYLPQDYVHAWAWVPPVTADVGYPTEDFLYQPMTAFTWDERDRAIPSGQTADMIVPGDLFPETYVHQVGTDYTSFNQQPYYWDEIGLDPNTNGPTTRGLTLKDGPRGVGTICYTTHIEVGRATQTDDPNSTPRRFIYVCDPWRFVRISNTGTIKTICGWRSSGVDFTYELVGDWSAIPSNKRGFNLIWGMCWDSRTLTVDPNAPLMDGRPPHGAGVNPRAYIADSRNDRICRVQFDGQSHETPVIVTEVFNGLGVWDCIEDHTNNTMIVSLRDQNKVVRMTFDGAILETIIERDTNLPGTTGVDWRHIAYAATGTLTELQAQPILSPEGLYLLDNLLYIGSKVQGQITVLDMTTRQIVRRVPVYISGNSNFVKFAVSDGSYAPRGTVFFGTFDVQEGGQWYGIMPDGKKWMSVENSIYGLNTYQMSFGIGGGRMFAGGSDYGIIRYFKGPSVDVNLYTQGQTEFHAMHGRIVYGSIGVGRFDIPNPSAALKYYLDYNRYGNT